MRKEWKELLIEALRELEAAVRELKRDTDPRVPMPRPRVFWFTRKMSWGWEEDGLEQVRVGEYSLFLYRDKEEILGAIDKETGGQPRKILRALRQIQAATRWCRARRAGRERMAEEILRQQKRAVEALEEERVLRKLTGK